MRGENLAKTKAWIHSQLGDCGTGSNFYEDPPHDENFPIGRVWKAAIDEMDRVTVRPQYSLVDPQKTVDLLPDEEVSRLPLVRVILASQRRY